MEKKKGNKFTRIMTWIIGILFVFIIALIALGSGEPSKSTVEAEAKEKAAEEKADAEKQAKADELIAKFNESTVNWTTDTQGVVTDTMIEFAGNHYQVKVFVDETSWASSDESSKLSFCTTIETRVAEVLGEESSFISIVSATNNDVVAKEKLLGGFDIKR